MSNSCPTNQTGTIPATNTRYRLPEITPYVAGASFLKDCVHYPFPVHYADLDDGRGVTWEIAYMDAFYGDHASRHAAPTMVLIHGRSVCGAYYGALMDDLLNAGYRVVVPDIPHYGKSLPGNLERPLTRSLEDVRGLIHHLLQRLTITRAAFLGHSLGGQIALGYALRYPEQVSRLILVAPAGLEEFNASPLFAEALQDDFEAWKTVWNADALIASEKARTVEDIRSLYYGRSGLWSFTCTGDYQEFVTRQRIGLISAPQELQHMITAIVRDFYNAAVENLKSDPNSLVKRTASLKMPVYLAMGEIDPFFPMRLHTGNTDVVADMIEPFQAGLAGAGNPPVVKIYRGIGHYIHTDAAEAFSGDLRAFLRDRLPKHCSLPSA